MESLPLKVRRWEQYLGYPTLKIRSRASRDFKAALEISPREWKLKVHRSLSGLVNIHLILQLRTTPTLRRTPSAIPCLSNSTMSTLEDLDDLEREQKEDKKDEGDKEKKPDQNGDAEMKDAEPEEKEEDPIDEEIYNLSTQDILTRKRLLENDSRIMKSEFQRLSHEKATMGEKIKDNLEKIENNRYPYIHLFKSCYRLTCCQTITISRRQCC